MIKLCNVNFICKFVINITFNSINDIKLYVISRNTFSSQGHRLSFWVINDKIKYYFYFIIGSKHNYCVS